MKSHMMKGFVKSRRRGATFFHSWLQIAPTYLFIFIAYFHFFFKAILWPTITMVMSKSLHDCYWSKGSPICVVFSRLVMQLMKWRTGHCLRKKGCVKYWSRRRISRGFTMDWDEHLKINSILNTLRELFLIQWYVWFIHS